MKRILLVGILISLGILLISYAGNIEKTDSKKAEAEGAEQEMNMKKLETATFGAGCFWGVEAAFMKVPGVVETAVGFMGGRIKNPGYREVCTGTTGHAEVVHLKYNPDKVTYDELLDIFWKIHDPTTVNRQGPDRGYQYRSVIFYHAEERKKIAESSKKNLQESKDYKNRSIATSIEPAQEFYRAEEYHQRYYEKHGITGGCHI